MRLVENIPGFEKYKGYEVHADGQVWARHLGRFLSQSPNSKGYLRVSLGRKTFLVHRLVAFLYIDLYPKEYQVNHKDGNKENNHYRNLEWAGDSEQQIHARDLGLNKQRGETSKQAKLTESDVREIRRLVAAGQTQISIAEKFGVSRQSISAIKTRRNWRHL